MTIAYLVVRLHLVSVSSVEHLFSYRHPCSLMANRLVEAQGAVHRFFRSA